MGNSVGTMMQRLKLTKKSEPEWKHMLTRGGCVHCGRSEDKNWTCPLLGSCSCPQNAVPIPSCVFYSPRIQGLFEGERTELETTQEHWTQVSSGNEVEMERVGEENRKYFNEVLRKNQHWGVFFSKFEGLIVKDKIGEGGQAEIFDAQMKNGLYKHASLVAKVFKKNMPLRDLERQWPIALFSKKKFGIIAVPTRSEWHPIDMVLGGAFIRDGTYKNRFAFVMNKRMCDLRVLLDRRMLNLLHEGIHGPPFEDLRIVIQLLESLSRGLALLHDAGVIHRDIKASNVLLDAFEHGNIYYDLMDFECALGAMGTGFWRAPEILEQVQRRVPSHEVVFTKEADIYSFGMLCYEVITGRIPFEGHPQNDYSIVLGGRRPELPNNLDSTLKRLVHDCWREAPYERPTGVEIWKTLRYLEKSQLKKH